MLYPHLLFHFVLSFSGWTYVTLALSETYEALLDGLQGALWALGGVPEVVRSDNLSAATHELAESKRRALNDRFAAVLAHHGMRSTRIAHAHTKTVSSRMPTGASRRSSSRPC